MAVLTDADSLTIARENRKLRKELAAEKVKLVAAVEALKWAWGTIYEADGKAMEDYDRDERLGKLHDAITCLIAVSL